jgi:hypothetical protein
VAFSNPNNASGSFRTTGGAQTITTPSAGQLLYVYVCQTVSFEGTDPGFAVTGFSQIGSTVKSDTGALQLWEAHFYKQATGAETSVTITVSNTNTSSTTLWAVSEYDGFSATPTLDIHAENGTFSSNGTTAQASTTNQQSLGTELAVTGLGLYNTSGGLSAANCWYGLSTGTKSQLTTFAGSNTQIYTGWVTTPASQSTNEWNWQWTTSRNRCCLGACFYSAGVPTAPARRPTQRRALRGWRLVRGRSSEAVPSQAVVVNPAIVFSPTQRRALRGWRLVRGRSSEAVPSQDNPAGNIDVVQPRRLRGWRLVRGRSWGAQQFATPRGLPGLVAPTEKATAVASSSKPGKVSPTERGGLA